jgi:4-hydroxybenzoate polyprenyltransferase
MSNCADLKVKYLPDLEEKMCNYELIVEFRKIFSFLTVSSLFIGATGFFKTFMVFIFLGIEPSLQVCLVVALMTFSVYSLNKLTDLKEDAVNTPERMRFLAGRKRLVLSYSLAAYLLSIFLAFIDTPVAVPIVFIPLAANLVYGSKLLPGVPRFKDIPVMKNLFVAITWAICATLLPIAHIGQKPEILAAVIVFGLLLMKSFVNTIIYDIRDADGDREHGVRTIPVLLGTKKTMCILMVLNGALLPWLFFTGSTVPPLALAMIFYGFMYIMYFRMRRAPLVLDFFVDGEWMHFCLLFLALRGFGFLA